MVDKPITSFNTVRSYHDMVHKLRTFFFDRGFIEVDTQSRLSILAACEDPKTIATYMFSGIKWPLPQTGQMWLEHELLTNPEVPGFFSLTTSYRDEPNPNPTRHLKLFPIFDFETHGDINTLQNLMADLFEFLGFGNKSSYKEGDYKDVAQFYGVKELQSQHEAQMEHDYSPIFFLKKFPFYTHPFFNMKKVGDVANKIDAILYGVETVGSAERSCNVDEMYELFHTISDGEYAGLLYRLFGKERVQKELKEFLSYDFFPRSGGGIGVTRLIRAYTLSQQGQPFIQQRPTYSHQAQL